MRTLTRATLVALTLILAAACTAQSPSASPTASLVHDGPSPEPSQEAPSSVPPSAAPSTDGSGTFTCDLPVHVDATVARANLTGVSVGQEDPAFDRIAFEFLQGLPEVSIERAGPPFTHDASGEPIEVEGTSWLRITLRGGTKQGDDGSSTYTGATEFNPEFTTLTHLVEGGDFEGQSTWIAGLNAEACIRVSTETDADASRLVIDLEN